MGLALDGFYYFEDDTIEDFIEKAMAKFEGVHQPPIRKFIWSNEAIRNKICAVAVGIYG